MFGHLLRQQFAVAAAEAISIVCRRLQCRRTYGGPGPRQYGLRQRLQRHTVDRIADGNCERPRTRPFGSLLRLMALGPASPLSMP